VSEPIDTPASAGDLLEQPAAPAPRRGVKRWITSGVVLALLAAIAIHLSRSHEELASVRRLSIEVLGLTCLLQLASQIFLNESLLLPLQRHVTRLGFWELYLVRTGGFFVGSVVPVAGGLAVRLAYLRSRGLTYLDFTWATLFSNTLALAAAAVLSLAAAGVLWLTRGTLPPAVVAVTIAVLAGSIAVMAAFEYLPRLTQQQAFRRWRWLAGMSGLKGSRPLVARVFTVSLLRHALNFVTFGLLYRSITGVPSDFLAGGLVYALTSPVRMVNVTPANLGVTEWFVAIVGRMVSFDLTVGLIVSLAFRGVAFVAQMAGALFGSAWLAVGTKR
jgi:hypothetical protein